MKVLVTEQVPVISSNVSSTPEVVREGTLFAPY